MAFGCIFVPNFMVQAVVRAEPALGDRAIAIIDGVAPVWSVVGVNEAASRAGIVIGMTKSQAQQFREIEIRHRSRMQEKAAHAALLDAGWSISPRVEDTAMDTVVVDIAGLHSLFGSEEKIARQLAERALSLGLVTQIVIASKIDAAILAARGFARITVIPEGEERKFLASLPVGVLAPWPEVLETLDRWGVHTCGALADLPVVQLSERLGQEGVRLHELAEARSERSMVLAEQAVHFEEEMELEDAVEELEPLSFLLGRLLDQLCARLAARSLAACAVRVRFELEPSFEEEFQRVRFRGWNRASGAKAPDKNAASMWDLKVRPPKNQRPLDRDLKGINRPSGTSSDTRQSATLRAGLSTIVAPRLKRTSDAEILEENASSAAGSPLKSKITGELFAPQNGQKRAGETLTPHKTKIAGETLDFTRDKPLGCARDKPALQKRTTPKIYERVLTLPVPMRDSKMLLKLVRLHLQGDAPSAPILKIFLAADAVRPRVAQGGLFLPSSPDPEKLELTLARLANLVGDSNVGSPELIDTHRPGEFRMRRFIPLADVAESRRPKRQSGPPSNGNNRAAPKSADKNGAESEPDEDLKKEIVAPRMEFRVFRPALPARVELREGCPARIDFQGMRGRVAAASGPWRSSGDWWREDGWHNDEWDLEIHFGGAVETRAVPSEPHIAPKEHRQRGFYRIFFDGIRKEWFVRGTYD